MVRDYQGPTPKMKAPDPGPPEGAEVEVAYAVAYCADCKEVVGPTHSEDVGETMAREHVGHGTELVDQWTETHVVGE